MNKEDNLTNKKVDELYTLLNEQKQNKSKIFLIPLSILFAGMLIGGSILYNGKIQPPTNTSAQITSVTTTPLSSSYTTATVSLAASQVEGSNKNAAFAIVEFSDFQCPYCDQFFKQSLPQLESNYIKNGKVLHFFKDFPLTTIHPNAMPGAIAARCAGDQGKYWQMHDKIYETDQATNDTAKLATYAQALNLNNEEYNSCVNDNKFNSQIQINIDQGNKLGVQGTPTFVIGKIDKKHNSVTGTVLYGAYPYDQYRLVLDEIIKKG